MTSMLWIQSGGCGGCTMSLLNAESPGLLPTLEEAGIELLWHPSLSEETGAEATAILEAVCAGTRPLDILCVEGSLLRGPGGSGRFHVLAGTGRATIHWVRDLAAAARHVVAVGTCAAYGGITAAGPNVTDACGLQYDGRRRGGLLGEGFAARGGLPVVNVAGCPTHPNWVTETLMLLAVEQGLDTCAQEYWARYPQTVAKAVGLPDDHMLFSGMALGYRDDAAPINTLRASRDPVDVWCELKGFE